MIRKRSGTVELNVNALHYCNQCEARSRSLRETEMKMEIMVIMNTGTDLFSFRAEPSAFGLDQSDKDNSYTWTSYNSVRYKSTIVTLHCHLPYVVVPKISDTRLSNEKRVAEEQWRLTSEKRLCVMGANRGSARTLRSHYEMFS